MGFGSCIEWCGEVGVRGEGGGGELHRVVWRSGGERGGGVLHSVV